MTTKRTLTDIFKESAMGHFYKHGSSYYKIMDISMGKTGHIQIDAEIYSSNGICKGLTALIPLSDDFFYTDIKDLPFDSTTLKCRD
jgi:hypothetical protein